MDLFINYLYSYISILVMNKIFDNMLVLYFYYFYKDLIFFYGINFAFLFYVIYYVLKNGSGWSLRWLLGFGLFIIL